MQNHSATYKRKLPSRVREQKTATTNEHRHSRVVEVVKEPTRPDDEVIEARNRSIPLTSEVTPALRSPLPDATTVNQLATMKTIPTKGAPTNISRPPKHRIRRSQPLGHLPRKRPCNNKTVEHGSELSTSLETSTQCCETNPQWTKVIIHV